MDLTKVTQPFSKSTYISRRKQLIQSLAKKTGGSFTALFWSGSEIARNSTAMFAFRAQSDFLYLTGFAEPETLILLQMHNGKARTAVGVRPRDLSARRGSEIWDGERLGVERAPKALGFDEAFDSEHALTKAKEWAAQTRNLVWGFGQIPEWDERVLGILKGLTTDLRTLWAVEAVIDPRPALHEMRKFKSAEEVRIMRQSAEIAAKGHIRAWQTTRAGHAEYEIQAEIEREFKRHGAQAPAYGSIVATGANACTLHYVANNAPVQKNDLILVDAGAEYFGYASDITRCYPASGKFSAEQRDVYSWVLKAQVAAIRAVRAGNLYHKPHDVACRILSQGLRAMGIIKKPAAEILKKGLYKAYMPHSTSHWLGMDVHDVGIYRHEPLRLKPVKLSAGIVLTVEPGLYFRADDKTVPARYRGIGVRIEDDVLVTRSGPEVLSQTCPKEIDEIEALCGPRL